MFFYYIIKDTFFNKQVRGRKSRRISKKLKLPYYSSAIDPDLFWTSIRERTYHRDGLQRIPLSTSIGTHTFVNDISYNEVVEACKAIEEYK